MWKLKMEATNEVQYRANVLIHLFSNIKGTFMILKIIQLILAKLRNKVNANKIEHL